MEPLFELRDHGRALGVECQIFQNEELLAARRFDPRLDASRPSRELAIQSVDFMATAKSELKADGHSQRQIAAVLGVDHETVRRDVNGANAPVSPKVSPKNNGVLVVAGANAPDPLDVVASLAATNDVRQQIDADERRAKRDEQRAASRRDAASGFP